MTKQANKWSNLKHTYSFECVPWQSSKLGMKNWFCNESHNKTTTTTLKKQKKNFKMEKNLITIIDVESIGQAQHQQLYSRNHRETSDELEKKNELWNRSHQIWFHTLANHLNGSEFHHYKPNSYGFRVCMCWIWWCIHRFKDTL